MNGPQISKLFSLIQDSISGLSERDVDRLLSGQGTLKIDVLPNNKGEKKESAQAGRIDLTELERALKRCENRSAGLTLVEGLTKADLERLAHRFDIHVDKSAKKEQISEKVIERVVGLRLRRHAMDAVALG